MERAGSVSAVGIRFVNRRGAIVYSVYTILYIVYPSWDTIPPGDCMEIMGNVGMEEIMEIMEMEEIMEIMKIMETMDFMKISIGGAEFQWVHGCPGWG